MPSEPRSDAARPGAGPCAARRGGRRRPARLAFRRPLQALRAVLGGQPGRSHRYNVAGADGVYIDDWVLQRSDADPDVELPQSSRQATTSPVAVKSGNTACAPAPVSDPTSKRPVATPRVRTPSCRPQATSRGVSPTTTTRLR